MQQYYYLTSIETNIDFNLDAIDITSSLFLDVGSVWNTFPPHTHLRRSEFYLYFDLAEDSRIFHFMGEEDSVKTLILKNQDVALSPSWSMHCGAGTSAYSFIWAMGGENQDFDDMDFIESQDLAKLIK